jgi:anaerobic magnesium-protoporphyrin IX monomethyl ester cyclase
MRALLVQSPATSPWVPRRQWEAPSLALATIAAQVEGHDVRVADMIVWRLGSVRRFLRALDQMRPEVVGFSAMTFQYASMLQFAALTRAFDPSIRIVLGGYHATLAAEQIADSPERDAWDFLIRGEGDFAFGELLDALQAGGQGLADVRGLSWKRDGAFVHNAPRPLEDVARIRIPRRAARIASGFHMYFRRADVIETSRGCLHNCNFCSIREMYGKSYRLFPIDRVLEDIEDAYQRGARHIFCTDDNITLDMDRFEALLDGVIRLKLENLMFTTQASPIGFAQRPGIAAKMARAGFVSIFLGIENGSAKSLEAMQKPNTLEWIRRGVRELQAHGLIVIAGIINGLQHDDEESIRQNYEFVKSLGITSVMDQLLTPYPKTPLRNDMLAASLVSNTDDFRWYDGYFANVRTDHLSPEALNFTRWRLRREVIGMWRPTAADWKYFSGYSYLWEYGFRHLVWLNERLLELVFGLEGRYKLQMRQFLQLNKFGFEREERTAVRSFHPVYGSSDDPFEDTRASLLRRKLALPLGGR